MQMNIPELSLVVLIGPSGAGKSNFARTHFLATEVISSDGCRGLIADDENALDATGDAFALVHFLAGKRLARGRLTVIDATNVEPESRKPLVALARDYHCLPVAIVFDLPARLCHARNAGRPDRQFGPHVVARQRAQLHRSIRRLRSEGFRQIYVFRDENEVESATVARQPLWNNRRQDHGPFDIIGDVHGCFDELHALLSLLGYQIERADADQSTPRVAEAAVATDVEDRASFAGRAPEQRWRPESHYGFHVFHLLGRRTIFLGDLIDRGPNSVGVLRLVMSMVAQGVALCVPGNHDMKLLRKLRGRDVQITHGLAETLQQLGGESDEFREHAAAFTDSLVSHYVLDDGRLVVAHAGMKAEMQGRGSGAVRDFALYGETTGESDEFGLPVRYNWAADYRGGAMVAYGHTPVPEAEWLNRTINIDTGCVFGGKLSALRYPERELVSVLAQHTYSDPRRPFLERSATAPALSAQQQLDDMLDLADVTGKRIIPTRLAGNVTIQAEQCAAALEVMSRFAIDPKWLIYLPPTMSPCETSRQPDLLEHPDEAFAYFLREGVGRCVCEQKHMGSRAVAVVCRDESVALRRFGVRESRAGVIYTRTGRRFFDDAAVEAALLQRMQNALSAALLWEELDTDWICLDCELMPWSAKAQGLLRDQYAPVASSGQVALEAAASALRQAAVRMQHGQAEYREAMPPVVPIATASAMVSVVGVDVGITSISAGTSSAEEFHVSDLLNRVEQRVDAVRMYRAAYQRYCWPVASINDLKLAPFHLLASEDAVHTNCDHLWHMAQLAKLQAADPDLFLATEHHAVDVTDPRSIAAAVAWWEALTEYGGEGMVVKPLEFAVRTGRGLVQPAVKCRGREYLRIIYGPEYTAAEHLERLRARGLGRKRGLALREFALGIEALERFVRREPLRRVHECVFGVLALESEPVDPRL